MLVTPMLLPTLAVLLPRRMTPMLLKYGRRTGTMSGSLLGFEDCSER